MATRDLTCAASSLTGALFDRAPSRLREVVRTRVSVHYETEIPELPLLCLCTPDAIRLPNSVVAETLPDDEPAQIGDGQLLVGHGRWRPLRWWTPPRPTGLPVPRRVPDLRLPLASAVTLPASAYDGLRPAALIGAGPGLTPAGDDLLAGALVTARATGDARTTAWARATRRALAGNRTTAVSAAMLHHALDGYATTELADFLRAVCLGDDTTPSLDRLLAVGHTSGTALAAGVLHTLTTSSMLGAA